MGKIRDITGRRFHRWTALALCGRSNSGKALWRCKCDCGTEQVVIGGNLISGISKSCGCWDSEVTALRNRQNTQHGHSIGGKTSREYNSWTAMIKRCYRPRDISYHLYGGRGIKVCQRWRDSFQHFFNDMGLRPKNTTLDRKDPYGNYEPSNCRWATHLEQAHNKRAKVGHYLA